MPAEAAATPSSSVSALQQRVDELREEVRARTAERDEGMRRELALAEVLQAINASAQVPTAVFDVILEKAMRLCAATFGYLMTYDGERFQVAASHSLPARFAEYLRNMDQPGPTGLYAAIRRGSAYGQVADLREGEVYRTSPLRRALVDLGGARTGIVVALRKDDSLLGVITIYRQEIRPFTDAEIALLQNFAAQGVIAIDSSRLFGELRESEARHALVSAAVAEGIYEWNVESNALWVSQRLIEIFGFEGRDLKAADWNELVHPDDFPRYRSALRDCFKGVARRLDCEYRVRHADGAYRWIEDRGVPVRNPVGQAVRLVGALTDVTARKEGEQALTEALEWQTATAEVLQVINHSPGDLAPVFDAMLEKAMRLCGATFGILRTYDGRLFHGAASCGVPPAYAEFLAQNPQLPQPGSIGARIVAGEPLVHVIDVADDGIYPSSDPHRRALVELGGARTSLVVPLTKNRRVVGAIQLYRQHVQVFSEKQVALVQNFAAQAVIAMENARLIGELRESLERQTATAEVLQVINASPGNLEPVFDAMLEKAIDLCGAKFGTLYLHDGNVFTAVALRNVPAAYEAAVLGHSFSPEGNPVLRYLQEHKQPHHLKDVFDEAYLARDPLRVAAVELGGVRSLIAVPLLKGTELIGFVGIYRDELGGFADHEIALVSAFADQAVIAIENARLITETREALEQQTATAEVLQVINSSPGDLAPVFDAMLERATRLCGVPYGQLALFDGEHFRFVAVHGETQFERQQPRDPRPPSWGITWPRIVDGENVVHISDVAASDIYRSGHDSARRFVDTGGGRSLLTVALRKDSQLLGALTVYSQQPRPFADTQIALLQTFSAQAVVAIENARLLSEQREALERQTATAEVLQIINASPGNLEPVFMSVLEKALRLCEAAFGVFWTYDGNHFHASALLGVPTAFADFAKQRPHRVGNDNTHARALRGETVMHIVDAAESEAYRLGDPLRRALVDLGGARTSLGVALRKDDALLGVLILYRKEVRPFSGRQISLIESFAVQAVVAMENARLLDQLHQRTDDLARSVDELSATGDVLKTISRSSTDLKAVLDTLLETVARLCRADQTYMFRRHEELHHLVAAYGVPPEGEEYIRTHPFKPRRGTTSGRVALERRTVHIEDVLSDPEYTYTEGQSTAGFRTMLGLPLLREDTLVGVFVLGRTRVEPFSPREIELASSFADQAVIAIENARLFEELRDRQAELRVTFDNMGDGVAMFDGDHRLGAWNRNFEQIMELSEEWLVRRPGYAEYLEILAERGEFGTENVEAELASRLEDTERELRLERTRADGSVIEVRRNAVPGGGFVLIYSNITERRRAEAEIRAARDAAEAALEQQTATAEILRAISESPTEVQPVLDAVVKAAVRFCGAVDALISLRDGESWIATAHEGVVGHVPGARSPLNRENAAGRSILDGVTCHLPNVAALDPVEFASVRRMAVEYGFAAVIAAPLLRDGIAIGAVTLRKLEPAPFTPQQISLLETFAAQAVIAIENVRLFTELRESLEQQTASAEVLRAISRSPTDVQPVFDVIAESALRLLGGWSIVVWRYDGEHLHLGAIKGGHAGSAEAFHSMLGIAPPEGTFVGDAIRQGKVQQIVDVEAEGVAPGVRELARLRGWRSNIAVPLMRESEPVGVFTLARTEPGAFSEREIHLLQVFADQAVIAVENVRLFTELRDSLERLKAAQANLIQAEKMASLGQLTAGIAHEIKNPLNFVNNFAGLSSELLDELKQAVDAVLAEPDKLKRAELQETMDLLTGNLAKILEHGRRADGIVKSMLSHSRGGTGDWQEANINALVEEALNLAYHGARAQDKDFNVTLERDFAPETKPIEVVPQDVTRVFLNLFGNGFYATRKRHLGGADAGYRPTLTVSTRDLGEAVEIRVRDNGTGIQPEVRAKLFQPFFTTKPTGEGTGLGLSISYDIVTQQHGGTIEVESEPGSFTEFTVRLPRSRRVAQSRGA